MPLISGTFLDVTAATALAAVPPARGAPLSDMVPASLVANWQAEAARFAPALRLFIAHSSVTPMRELAALAADSLNRFDVVVTSYSMLSRLPWIAASQWSLAVLDEAQAIKNPGAQQTRAVKALRSRVRLALTGTPVENRLGDLWSLYDFICPGLLGSAEAFGRFARRLARTSTPITAPCAIWCAPIFCAA